MGVFTVNAKINTINGNSRMVNEEIVTKLLNILSFIILDDYLYSVERIWIWVGGEVGRM